MGSLGHTQRADSRPLPPVVELGLPGTQLSCHVLPTGTAPSWGWLSPRGTPAPPREAVQSWAPAGGGVGGLPSCLAQPDPRPSAPLLPCSLLVLLGNSLLSASANPSCAACLWDLPPPAALSPSPHVAVAQGGPCPPGLLAVGAGLLERQVPLASSGWASGCCLAWHRHRPSPSQELPGLKASPPQVPPPLHPPPAPSPGL